MLNRFITFISIFTFAFSAYAVTKTDLKEKILMIHYWQGVDGTLFKLKNMGVLSAGCRNDFIMVPRTHPDYDGIVKMLIAAKVSGDEVKISVYDTDACVGGFKPIRHIYW